MNNNDRVFILISNYLPDKQESMRRYAEALKSGLAEFGYDVELWTPPVIFSCLFRNTGNGLGKWLGYLDKWIIYPLILKLTLCAPRYRKNNVCFHVCDHSNAPYLAVLPKNRSGITCHDVLAIQAALGYEDTYCEASKTGRILQSWILRNLMKAERLVAVSQYTMDQLLMLSGSQLTKRKWTVVHNFYNAEFYHMPSEEYRYYLKRLGIPEGQEFILHIGSSLPRKNRRLLIKLLVELGNSWNGKVCFTGQPIDSQLAAEIEKYGLKERVISVVKPTHLELIALYSACVAFVFPSYSEGFGWPVIEAQACGAPVLASNISPIKEIGGEGALLYAPDDVQGFASGLKEILNTDYRQEIVQKGFQNTRRFERRKLIAKIIELYN